MTKQIRLRLSLLILCMAAALSLCACNIDADVSVNDTLGRQFMDHALADDYDSAYGTMNSGVSKNDFLICWNTLQTVMEGAKSYEMEQKGWNVTRTGKVTTSTSTFMVCLDNGRTVSLVVTTRDDLEGITNIQFTDVTDFIKTTDAYVPVVQIVLYVFSTLAIGFGIWMLIDCICRKMKTKYKVLWIILILLTAVFTLTLGPSNLNVNFSIGLFATLSKIRSEPLVQTVTTSISVPVCAIVYFFLRKRLTLRPKTEESADQVLDMDDSAEASASSASTLPADGASETSTDEPDPTPAEEEVPPPDGGDPQSNHGGNTGKGEENP